MLVIPFPHEKARGCVLDASKQRHKCPRTIVLGLGFATLSTSLYSLTEKCHNFTICCTKSSSIFQTHAIVSFINT